jgi:hypothetical protein
MISLTEKSIDHEIKAIREQSQGNRRGGVANIAGESMNLNKNSCPAYGKSCKNCGFRNHFSRVCLKKRNETTRLVKEITQDVSSDSGDSVYTVSVLPEFPDDQEVLAVQTKYKQFKSRILTVMNIKGGRETSFQVDTGATCNVIKQKELSGTKYMKKMNKTKQVLKMYNPPL